MNSIDDSEVAELLAPQTGDETATVARLHARLERAADEAGSLDIAYRTFDTPVGRLLLAATDRGLVRVAYEREDHDHVLDTLSTRISPRILQSPRRLDAVVRELDEYFARSRTTFDLPLDHALSHGFRRSVLDHLPEISYGRTESYAQVARAAGSPRAVRAVGTACATNPLPLVVPCHRVIRSDGSFGQYAGGPDAKRALLELEAEGASV
jgi:methylated-DNA-[protein]-cysteine S-methyltransferase